MSIKILSGDNFEEHKLTDAQYQIIGGRVDQMVNTMVGEVLQLIEVLGLKETQEEAVKSKIRNVMWNTLSNHLSAWENFVNKKCDCDSDHWCANCKK